MYSKAKQGREWKTTKSSLLCQKLVQLLVAPLQGQADGRCPLVVVDAESSSSTRLLEQKPRQPQQPQPHRKMHQSFPRDVLWEGRKRKKEREICRLVGKGNVISQHPSPTTRQLAWSWQPKGTCSTWKNSLAANSQETPVSEWGTCSSLRVRDMPQSHSEGHASVSGWGTCLSLTVRDMPRGDCRCSGPLMLRLTTAVNVKIPPFSEQPQPPPSYSTPEQKCGQVGFPGWPKLLLTQPGPGFRDGQILLSNGMLINPTVWRKKKLHFMHISKTVIKKITILKLIQKKEIIKKGGFSFLVWLCLRPAFLSLVQ